MNEPDIYFTPWRRWGLALLIGGLCCAAVLPKGIAEKRREVREKVAEILQKLRRALQRPWTASKPHIRAFPPIPRALGWTSVLMEFSRPFWAPPY